LTSLAANVHDIGQKIHNNNNGIRA